MYSTLSYLPTLLLNQSYEAYLQEHLFEPLNMTSTTFDIAKAEDRLAEGHAQHSRDMKRDEMGSLKPIIPFNLRPSGAAVLAGAGGVLSSARDLVRQHIECTRGEQGSNLCVLRSPCGQPCC